MTHLPIVLSRFVFVVAISLLVVGCDGRKPSNASASKAAGPDNDAEATALAGLEGNQGLASCRTALQQLDAQEGAGRRPTLSEPERAALTALFRLTPAEIAELGQATFSQIDAGYLEECLLVRAGVKSLHLEGRAPLDRANAGFDWVCRLIYLDDRTPWPANPWTTLEGGSGVPMSRAYAVLAAWQQLGLDGCLVGPPALKTTHAFVVQPSQLDPRPRYAPVRACGVQVGGDLYLFDPASGKALSQADGKDVLTLAAARQKPESVPGFDGDDVKSWQAFLVPPLPALSMRMEWLEQRNPAGSGVRLFVNASAQREKLGGTACEVWSPEGDTYSLPRILARFAGEKASGDANAALRDLHQVMIAPRELLPKTNLNGRALEDLTTSFLSQFITLRYSPNSPRDLLVRGQYREAMTDLDEIKKTVDNARARIDQDPTVLKDYNRMVTELQALSARVVRPDPSDPNGAEAQRALNQFRNNPRIRDVERAFVMGLVARPLAAEVVFLTAECVHERAERAQAEGSAGAKDQWRNAAEWWQRFLDGSVQANSPYPPREPHARNMLARCQQFVGK
jgi:hypothetical protein